VKSEHYQCVVVGGERKLKSVMKEENHVAHSAIKAINVESYRRRNFCRKKENERKKADKAASAGGKA